MPIQYTQYPIKTSTGTAIVKTAINPNNPAEPPFIVDKNNIPIYYWNVTNNKWIPPEDRTGNNLLPSNAGFSPTENYGSLLTQNEKIFTDNTTRVINNLPVDEKKLFEESNSYKPYTSFAERSKQQTQTPASGTATESTPNPITTEDLNIEQIQGIGRKWDKEIYYYPTSIQKNGQDFIKFDIIKYQTTKIDKKNSSSIQEKNYTKQESLATIILPIQPSITDRNLVEWGNNPLNPVELAGYSLMSGKLDDVTSILGQLGDTVTKDENVKAITLYLKQKAINVEGLISRFGGAIVNPNLELIFQGPTLRPFNFTFRLSPRNDEEAIQVISIIRAFKEAMAPQSTTGGLFLATPNVFNISYHTIYRTKGEDNKEKPHPSLNKIKTCALQSCDVDYTPDGSYMTFNNEKRTMTSYNLTLQFIELEPVTSKDYDTKYDEIGY